MLARSSTKRYQASLSMLSRLVGCAAVLAIFAASSALAGETDAWFTEEYSVKANETLDSIARRTSVPRDVIASVNGLKEPFLLSIGRSLRIPRGRIHVVKDNETKFSIAIDHGVPWQSIATANSLDHKADPKPGQYVIIPLPASATPPNGVERVSTGEISAGTEMTKQKSASAKVGADLVDATLELGWPAMGTIHRPFADRGLLSNYHDGIDISISAGSLVRASASGKVIFAGRRPDDFGLAVTIDHGHGWTTTYGFLKEIAVKPGNQVIAGDRIGRSGTSPVSNQPQIHFEVRRQNKPVDPVKYMQLR